MSKITPKEIRGFSLVGASLWLSCPQSVSLKEVSVRYRLSLIAKKGYVWAKSNG
jgi:hypothetical protein